jgi:hypothetical protein
MEGPLGQYNSANTRKCVTDRFPRTHGKGSGTILQEVIRKLSFALYHQLEFILYSITKIKVMVSQRKVKTA